MNIKISKDWWLATGLIEIFVSVIGIISKLNTDAMSGAFILGVTQIIFGIGLLQKSKLVFWLGLIMSGYNVFQVINSIAKGAIGVSGIYSFAILLVGLRFACYVMLFQQIRKAQEKK